MRNNINITNLNHLQLLQELNISGKYCTVNEEGISELRNIKKLNLCNNKNITNLNHFQLLEELNISGNCDANHEEISKLRNIKIK